ncbi:N-6 DNA methylase [archaeon D22]|nr:N-6 DNA methylase [archaeon D22]
MLDADTKRRIDTARDILVGKLPDPKSQVEQITIALIYKFMDDMDKQSEELGGVASFFTGDFAKYSWTKIFDPRLGGHELVALYGEAIQQMNYNKELPDLFRDIFKNAYLPYRDPETLKSFLKTINEFEYDHSEKLGDAFEYLLSVMGSQGDAGQFRTPRHIIDFIVKVVDPSKTETVLDPATGTAGFLISSYKHILEKNKKEGRVNLTPDEMKRLTSNFSGYDISPDMVRLSLVNLYLHGFSKPKIFEYDTLTSDEKWDETFDVILANPPFMTPKGGIKPHNRFQVKANRAEVLFVDYIAEHLNVNGRAGIVVPEGIIFQSGSAYKKLRKELIESYGLYGVVSLPSGVFNPYSGVKTSILLLDKRVANQNKEILFVKIEKDGYSLGAQRRAVKENDLPLALEIIKEFQSKSLLGEKPELEQFERTIAHIVPKEQVAENGDYNLSGDRYKENVVYDGKWDLVELGEVCEFINGRAFKSSEWVLEGESSLPIIRIQNLNNQNAKFNYYNGEYNKDIEIKKGDLLFSWSGSKGTSFGPHLWNREKGLLNQHIFKVNHSDKYNRYFLYLALKVIVKKVEENLHGGVGIVHITKTKLKQFKIPLPPIEIQEQVVTEIQNYQKIIDGAKQVVDNYKPSFKVDPEWGMVELGEACDVRDGTHDSPKYQDTGYPLITSKNVKGNQLDFSNVNYISKEDFDAINKRSLVEDGDIIMPMIGTIGNPIVVKKEQDFAIKNVALIKFKDNTVANNYYIKNILSSPLFEKYIEKVSRGGTQKFISLKNIRNFKVPLPAIEIQNEIVGMIHKERELISSSEELLTMFETKIKDKISEVLGA